MNFHSPRTFTTGSNCSLAPGALDKSGKRKLKKKTNVTKAIVGLSLEDMQAKRARQGELRKKVGVMEDWLDLCVVGRFDFGSTARVVSEDILMLGRACGV